MSNFPNFIDQCTIQVQAGNGGPGSAAFRREANNPRGGPAGGDGGHGGSVILWADPQAHTLHDVQYRRSYQARSGEAGQGRDRHGKGGEDVLVPVPVGTLVRDADSGELLCDLSAAQQRFTAAKGGRGGLGNLHFATATNQAPHRAEPGEEGERRTLRLELRLLADVGLLGFPNVGKSTLISRVSRARPKIADYPFTTLTPQLGVVSLGEGRGFVLADVPGLIEGAHRGQGLGLQFLRHLTRTRLLIHLLELSPDPDRHPLRDFDVLNQELARYDADLRARPQIVVLGKIDLTETRAALPELRAAFAAREIPIPLHAISAATGEGVAALMEIVEKSLRNTRA